MSYAFLRINCNKTIDDYLKDWIYISWTDSALPTDYQWIFSWNSTFSSRIIPLGRALGRNRTCNVDMQTLKCKSWATWNGRKISRRLLGTGRKLGREAAPTRSHETKTTLRFVAIKLRNGGSEHDQMRTAPRASSRSRQNRWLKKEEQEELNETREKLPPGKTV